MGEVTEIPTEPAAPAAEVPPTTAAPEPAIPISKEGTTPAAEPTVPKLDKSPSLLTKGGALFGKAKGWAQEHPKLAIGGVAGTAAFATVIAAAYPLWKKVIQPHLAKVRKERATGRGVVKRSVEDEYLDELVGNDEFLEFMSELVDVLEE